MEGEGNINLEPPLAPPQLLPSTHPWYLQLLAGSCPASAAVQSASLASAKSGETHVTLLSHTVDWNGQSDLMSQDRGTWGPRGPDQALLLCKVMYEEADLREPRTRDKLPQKDRESTSGSQ